jgi:Divergent InlB B-repeat domain
MNRILPILILGHRGRSQKWLSQSPMNLLMMSAALLLLFLAPLQRSDAAYIYVTTIQDKISSTGGCSLKEAIYASNLRQSIAVAGYDSDGTPQIIPTECVAGNGSDTIVLPPNALLQLNLVADDATGYTGPSATPTVTSNLTIEAYGATLQRIGSKNMRLFVVGPNATLTIRNAYIKGFVAQGGNGNGGGGGGLGAGGAIFTNTGTLTLEFSTFEGNFAAGGNGSFYGVDYSGGGGGGMGGDGGPRTLFGAGGGGGGSRGAGGPPQSTSGLGATVSPGGGGGGTVQAATASLGGIQCGANGGDVSDDGGTAACAGGGGGGGGAGATCIPLVGLEAGNGGNGNYGGGGGGGGNCGNVSGNDGGSGGFGGGGGAAGGQGAITDSNGGNGGFGGGAGVSPDNPGSKGLFGGSASNSNSGGGAGLGGAIFNYNGTVIVQNSTFTRNDAVGGRKADDQDTIEGTGEGHGGAIFSLNGTTTVENVTIDGNLASGSGGGIYLWQDTTGLIFGEDLYPITFILRNSIIANSGGSDDAAANQCTLNAAVITGGDWRGNLIQNNDSCDYNSGSGTVSSADPLLGPLQNNGGYTPTMAIGENSPAWNRADVTTSTVIDQRGSKRPELGGYDIGAYELCDIDPTTVCKPLQLCFFQSLTIGVSPAAGGTTSPSPGTTVQCLDSIVSLTAIPNPGYTFTGWSGNVSYPANASTVLVMAEPQSVTANFVSCNCATNVGGSVTVTHGPIVLNPITKRYAQTITVINSSATLIAGPIVLILDGLSANATLYNAAGTTDSVAPPVGSPYLSMNGSLAPGQMASFSLQFTNSTNSSISYTTRVLAGPGSI